MQFLYQDLYQIWTWSGLMQSLFHHSDNILFDDETALFAAGDIGIEYSFEIPLLISLDFRPEIGFGDINDDLDFDIALGLRYQF